MLVKDLIENKKVEPIFEIYLVLNIPGLYETYKYIDKYYLNQHITLHKD